jgi:squalene-hopene/tetraprenyl-beta-curcumene cyclase
VSGHLAPISIAQDTAAAVDKAAIREMVSRSVDYLKQRGQAPDGSFSKSVGITAVAAAGLTAVGISDEDPVVKKSFEYLLGNIQPDGGIYVKGSTHANYETCISIMALNRANKSGKYTEAIKNAEKFVRKEQWDESENITTEDLKYGGAGYGSKARPDMSNTAFMVETLHQLGAGKDDPAIQRALTFITRCQNLESPQNSSPFAAKVNDGGFYYTVAAGGSSVAGTEENGGLRSYSAMTYAGLKSMIYAGLDEKDPRVMAAQKYLRNNYSVETNPNLGMSGLYYYYMTMSKALKVNGEPIFEAKDGKHDWKAELTKQLKARQREDGSWFNEEKRFMESDPNLVTGYALLVLATITDS